MDDYLLAFKVSVAEGGGHVNDRLWIEVRRYLIARENPLKHGQPKRKKTCIGRGNHKRVGAFARHPGDKGKDGQLLCFQPFKGLLTHLLEILPKRVVKLGFVGGLPIADIHAVGIAAAHVGFRIVGGESIGDAAD